ncbi:hypothetical protein D3C71_1630660 [compost metagenome]
MGAAVDHDVIGNFDMLPGKCGNGLDQRREPTIAKPPPEISSPSCLLGHCGRRRADEDEITGLDRTIEFLDAPEPERLARRQVQSITADGRSRNEASDSHH